MSLPVVTDPWFYAVAIPAVLLMSISKSGFGAGFGSLAVPLMAMVTTVPQAAAVLMPVLLLMDLISLAAFRREAEWKLLRFLLPWALVGVLIGALTFGLLDTKLIAGLVGVFTLLFLLQRLLFPPSASSPPFPRWVGSIMVMLSGFTSFVAHAGGPALTAYVLPMRLRPLAFTGTMAIFFLVVNQVKWIPYALLGLLDSRNMLTSLLLLPFVPVGMWVGIRIARRIDPVLFYRLIQLGMLLTGIKLVWDAFR